MAPEYASFGQLSDKVDIYSFGSLCLEVVSGQKSIDQRRAPTEMYLSQQVSLSNIIFFVFLIGNPNLLLSFCLDIQNL